VLLFGVQWLVITKTTTGLMFYAMRASNAQFFGINASYLLKSAKVRLISRVACKASASSMYVYRDGGIRGQMYYYYGLC